VSFEGLGAMTCKDLYLGHFIGRHKIHIERCMAYSEKQAYLLLCRRVAKKYGISHSMVMNHFKPGDNCNIKKEIKFEEVEDGD
jgi:hypothetical protein